MSELSLQELLDVKISVASRRAQTVGKSPAPAVVFTREEIQRMGLRTLEELLNYVPGFSVTLDNIQNQIMSISVRGVRDFLSKGILFLVDGEPINDAFAGSAVALNRWIPLENVAQVEIIRGPGSALYGSQALLAVVNIVTLSKANDVSARWGSTTSQSLAVSVAQTTGKFQVVGFARGFADNGFRFRDVRDGVGQVREVRDPMRGFDLNMKLTYDKGTSLTLRHSDRTAEDFFGYTASGAENRAHYQQSQGYLRHQASLLEGAMQLSVQGGYTLEYLDVNTVVLPAGTELAPGVRLPEAYLSGPVARVHTARAASEASWTILPENTLVAGLSYSYTFIDQLYSRANHDPVTLAYVGTLQSNFTGGTEVWNNPDAKRHLFSVYLQDQHDFDSYVSLTAGSRFDYYNDVGASLAPRVAVVGHLPISGELKLLWGRAFRAPNFFELYDRNNPVDYGNKKLNLETIETFEAVYEQLIGDVLAGSISVYHNNIDNLIVPGTDAPMVPDNPIGGKQYVNVPGFKSKGLEIEARAEPLKHLLLRLTFTHVFDGAKLRFPQNSASGVIGYDSDFVGVNFNGIYQGKLEGTPQRNIVLLNAAVQVRPIPDSRSLSFNLSLQNLLDKRYYTISTYGIPDGLPNRGRTFFLELVASL